MPYLGHIQPISCALHFCIGVAPTVLFFSDIWIKWEAMLRIIIFFILSLFASLSDAQSLINSQHCADSLMTNLQAKNTIEAAKLFVPSTPLSKIDLLGLNEGIQTILAETGHISEFKRVAGLPNGDSLKLSVPTAPIGMYAYRAATFEATSAKAGKVYFVVQRNMDDSTCAVLFLDFYRISK